MRQDAARVLFGSLALLVGSSAFARSAGAQRLTRPARRWVTYDTRYFRVHAPDDLAGWARSVAERLDAVRAREAAVVGFVPRDRTDVVVDDPQNDPNGSAYPFLRRPAVFLWPVAPSPRSAIGNTRDWREDLAVHEFAHVAHLTRPSRNRLQRLWRGLLPEGVGPVATRTPRWAIEGYATYVEGALTGSGRPHGAYRAAVLRTWALEGALPSYAGMSGAGGYLGGSFAYLMGSAYLEYLGARAGDSSLTAVWRRSSARVNRPFDQAFAGVYGESPAALYNRFTARVTAEAFAAQARLDSAGRVEGTLVQRLAYGTGDPALSPDGHRLAVTLGATPGAPSRVVVWRVGPGAARDVAADSVEARAQRRLLRRDPEDVPAVRAVPRPRPPVAVLLAANGRAHADPRFFADGRRVLVARDERTEEDVYRPDLFVWDTRTGRLTRATRGAGVREADPSPDGRSAAAVRCAGGRCDLVRVDLATGTVRSLAVGAYDRTWTRPRWSPDGRRLVAAVQRNGRWCIALVDAATGAATVISPDDGVERYDPAFTSDGAALVYTSEAGGVPNSVRLPLAGDAAAGAEQPLTRVASAAFAPAASRLERAVYFLHLTPHGLDLRRVQPDSAPVRGPVVPVLAPATLLPRDTAAAVRSAVAQRPPVPADTFALGTVRERPYGLGPRRFSLLPLSAVSPDGTAGGLQLAAIDPAGRLSVLAQAAAADPRVWAGGALRVAWRGWPATVTGELFAARQALGANAPNARVVLPPALADRDEYRGATLAASAGRSRGAPRAGAGGAFGAAPASTLPDTGRSRPVVGPRDAGADLRATGRLGLHAGRGSAPAVRGRGFAFGEAGASAFAARGLASVGVSFAAQLATGRTAGAAWTRGLATARLSAGGDRLGIAAEGTYAAAGRTVPTFEQPLVGGPAPLLFDGATFGQRLALPALPTGYRAGRRAAVARVTLGGVGLAGFAPYAAAVSAGERLAGWGRLVGLEQRFTGPFAPFTRLPEVRVVAGVARIFDAPLANRTRGYVSVGYTP